MRSGTQYLLEIILAYWNISTAWNDAFNVEFCSAMSLLAITRHNSYEYTFKTFPSHYCRFLVIERCVSMFTNSLSFVLDDDRNFILGFIFLILGIRRLCLSNSTTGERFGSKRILVDFVFRNTGDHNDLYKQSNARRRSRIVINHRFITEPRPLPCCKSDATTSHRWADKVFDECHGH